MVITVSMFLLPQVMADYIQGRSISPPPSYDEVLRETSRDCGVSQTPVNCAVDRFKGSFDLPTEVGSVVCLAMPLRLLPSSVWF